MTKKTPEEKLAADLARIEAEAAKKEAKWAAQQKMREVRNAFHEKHPDAKGPMQAAMAWSARALDSISGVAFIKGADRGILAALAACVIACYGLDLIFFGSKAPDWWLAPLFILIGFVFRTIAIAAGVMLESLKDRPEEKRARMTWRFLFVCCVTACAMSAVSFFVGGYQMVQSSEAAITTVSNEQKGSVDAQVAALQKQQADIRTDRDKNIASLQKSIDNITTDKLDNDELADPYRKDQEAERNSARERIAAIDTTITNLIADKGTTATQEAKDLAAEDVKTASTWAVFSWVSKRSGAQEQDVVDFGMLFLALVIEFIAAFGPGAYYGIHRKFNAIVKKMTAMEAEEIAHLDAEVAQIEQRTAMARAMAAAARTADLDDDEAVLQQAKRLEEDAARDLALAESEAKAKELRAKAEAIRNPPPPPPAQPDEPVLTGPQRNGRKGGQSTDYINSMGDNVVKFPVEDLSDRETAATGTGT